MCCSWQVGFQHMGSAVRNKSCSGWWCLGHTPCGALTELLSVSSDTSPHRPTLTAVPEPSGAALVPVLPHMMPGWEKARDNEQRLTRMLPWQGAEGVSPLACVKGEKKKSKERKGAGGNKWSNEICYAAQDFLSSPQIKL